MTPRRGCWIKDPPSPIVIEHVLFLGWLRWQRRRHEDLFAKQAFWHPIKPSWLDFAALRGRTGRRDQRRPPHTPGRLRPTGGSIQNTHRHPSSRDQQAWNPNQENPKPDEGTQRQLGGQGQNGGFSAGEFYNMRTRLFFRLLPKNVETGLFVGQLNRGFAMTSFYLILLIIQSKHMKKTQSHASGRFNFYKDQFIQHTFSK